MHSTRSYAAALGAVLLAACLYLGLGEDELESPFVSSQCPRIRQESATKYAKRSTTQLSICARECTGFIDLKQQL